MPDTTNIISLPDALTTIGNRIDAAYERTKCGRQEWIEGSLELAAALLDGRERMGNVAFGAWLRANNHNHVNDDDRAALLHFAENPVLARTVLEDSSSNSYQLIWRAEGVRFRNATNTNSTPNRTETTNRGNEVSTGRGPWTNVVDERIRVLLSRGTTREGIAQILTAEFPELVADRVDDEGRPAPFYTKNMVINATRRLGLVDRSPSQSTSRPPRTTPRLVPTPAPRERNTTRINALTPQQIDPEFTGTSHEFMDRHGHVSLVTAEQKATDYFSAITAEMRSAARAIQEMEVAPQRHFIDYWLGWLRRPKPRDTERLAEAIAILKPRLVEAEAWLARARAATSSTAPAPSPPQ